MASRFSVSSRWQAARQAAADVAANFSYLLIGIALWVGVLWQLRTVLQDYLDVGTVSGRNLVAVAVAGTTVTLWYLTSAAGPVAQSPAQLGWLRSDRSRHQQVALTWLWLIGATVVEVVSLASLVDLSDPYVTVVAFFAGSTIFAVPILAFAQRFGIEAITTALIGGFAAALVVVMGVYSVGAPSSLAGVAAFICLAVAGVVGLLRWWPLRHLKLKMIPRWSLIRAAAVRDALTGIAFFFDETAALVYRDQYRHVSRRHLSFRPFSFITRAWLRSFGQHWVFAVGAVVTAAFTARVTTGTAGAWVALVSAIALTFQVAPTWSDWVSAAALPRMLRANRLQAALLFLVLLTIPAFTAGLAGLVIRVTAGPSVVDTVWFYVAAVALPWLVLGTIGRQAANPKQEQIGFILTPDGMLVPVGLFERFVGPVFAPLILATVTVVWFAPAAVVALAVEGFHLISRVLKPSGSPAYPRGEQL